MAFFSAKGPWWLTSSSALHRALTIKRFKGHGLFFHGSDGGCLIRRTAVIRTRMPGGGWGGIARWPPISIDRSEHRGSSVDPSPVRFATRCRYHRSLRGPAIAVRNIRLRRVGAAMSRARSARGGRRKNVAVTGARAGADGTIAVSLDARDK